MAGLHAGAPYGAEAVGWRARPLMLRGEAEALAGSGSTARAAGPAAEGGEFYTSGPKLERLLSAALESMLDRNRAAAVSSRP